MFIYLPSSALHLSCQQHFPLQRVERFLILIISHIDNLFRQIITNLPGGISWCHNPEIKLFRHMCFFFFFYLICHGFYTIGRSSIVNRGCIDISLILIQQKSTIPRSKSQKRYFVMRLQGLEPWTRGLRVRCSTNWAKSAYPCVLFSHLSTTRTII